MSPELQVVIAAAKKGAETALAFYDKNIATQLKEDKTVVTEADIASEKAIKELIRASYPDAKFVAEESGGDIKEDELWIVDPVDGTRSFSRGVPTWCVLIAYYKNGDVQLGVCYFPLMNILLYAEHGKGAFLNDKQVHVSEVPDLSKSYISFGSPHHFKDPSVVIDFMKATASLRIPDLTFGDAMVAKGAMEACIDAYGMVWDLAPFKVIIEEAGGKITRLDGTPWTLEGKGGVMSNGLVHDQVLEILNKKN